MLAPRMEGKTLELRLVAEWQEIEHQNKSLHGGTEAGEL